MSERFDLVVAGGGIIGLSVAYEACRRGRRVLVLARDEPGAATPASAGMLASAAEAAESRPALVALAVESCRLYGEFVAGVESVSGMACGYDAHGTLMLALYDNHWAELEQLAAVHQQLGLRVEALTAAMVREREPYLSPRQLGGLWLRDDHQVEPRALSAALTTAIGRLGAVRLGDGQATALSWRGEELRGVTIERHGETIDVDTPALVVAAGVWSNDAVPAPLGQPALLRLPLRPVRGQVVRLAGAPLCAHVIRTPDVYLVPRRGGELLVGAVSDENGLDRTPRAGAVLALLRDAWTALPGVSELAFVDTPVGFRPTLRDHLPAIGPLGGGLYVATGHFRHGVTLAPVTARLLIDAIETGEPSARLAPFLPSRFKEDQDAHRAER